MTLTLGWLAEWPEAIPTLARWHVAEWRHLLPTWTEAEAARELATHRDRRVPTTVIARLDGALAGSASLLLEDMPGTEAWSPWLASVYVAPGCRRRGIGGALVDRVVAEARLQRFPRLHLLTTEAEAWYGRWGWRPLQRLTCAGQPAIVMGLDLGP